MVNEWTAISIKESIYEALTKRAKKERRSATNCLELILEGELAEELKGKELKA